MEIEKIKSVMNVCSDVMAYLYEKLCANKMINTDWGYSEFKVEEKSSVVIYSINGVFSQKVYLRFDFENPVTDFWGYLIQESVYEQLLLILGSRLEEKRLIEKAKEEIYCLVIKKFTDYMRNKFFVNLEDIIAISSMYYEGAQVNGNLYLILNESELKPLQILGNSEQEIMIEKKNLRKIRKNLEMTYDDLQSEERCPVGLGFIYRDGWTFQGIVSQLDKEAQILRFHFVKHMVWELYGNDEIIIRYNCGSYDKPVMDYEFQLNQKLFEIMPNSIDVEKVGSALAGAMKQKHGTILVILNYDDQEAEDEADRLTKKSTGTRIKIHGFNELMIERLTSVEGALLMDSKGNLLAYGVILDTNGKDVEVEKDSSRGSRYHSAKKYIKSLSMEQKTGLAIIVSEDGMVNFYSTKDAEKEENNGN